MVYLPLVYKQLRTHSQVHDYSCTLNSLWSPNNAVISFGNMRCYTNARSHCGARKRRDRTQHLAGAQVHAIAQKQQNDETGQSSPRAVLGTMAAACVALSSAIAPPANALLSSPNVQLPRSPEAALRRSVPAVVSGSANAQQELEDVAYNLRIPQRKPWGSMQKEVSNAKKALEADRESGNALATVLSKQQETAIAKLDALNAQLSRVEEQIQLKDPEATSAAVAKALAMLSDVETLQAPSLPFSLPKSLASKPRLEGRATVDLTYERPDGQFGLIGGERPKELTLRCVLDGYSAPLTAGNFALRAKDGFFNGSEVQFGGEALFNRPDSSKTPPTGATTELPIEFRPLGSFEPVYRVELDTQTGVGSELPSLPISVYGSMAMTRSPEQQDLASPGEFFFFLYSQSSSGLGGLSFEEGQWPCFGYVVEGAHKLRELGSGDRLKEAKLIDGEDRLVVPQGQGMPMQSK